MKHIYEIAQIKLKDVSGVDEKNVSGRKQSSRVESECSSGTMTDHDLLFCIPLQMCKIVAGTARSMGIRIVR